MIRSGFKERTEANAARFPHVNEVLLSIIYHIPVIIIYYQSSIYLFANGMKESGDSFRGREPVGMGRVARTISRIQ